jgi:hypothetical protein
MASQCLLGLWLSGPSNAPSAGRFEDFTPEDQKDEVSDSSCCVQMRLAYAVSVPAALRISMANAPSQAMQSWKPTLRAALRSAST